MSLLKNDEMKLKVIEYDNNGFTLSQIESELGIPTSTTHDFLNKNTYGQWWSELSSNESSTNKPRKKINPIKLVEPIKIITTSTPPEDGCKHIMIPDTQVHGDLDLTWLSWVGLYIADKRPDVIVHIGDHFDLPSLSPYDKSTKKAEGRRLNDDINAGIEGMNKLLQPIKDIQDEELALFGEVRYTPYMVFCIGNHEQRLERHVNANPELHGLVSYSNFKLDEMGWVVYDFLEAAVVNGVAYVHYQQNNMTGKPLGGSALNRLTKVGHSVSMGHQQTFDFATRFSPITGEQQSFLVAGACYPHDEDYKGYAGNNHYRGLIVKHRVRNGSYSLMDVRLDYLEERYG